VPFERTIRLWTERGEGGHRACGRVDDHFHGFEVHLDVVDGNVVGAEAVSHKQPWTTCHGALPSVAKLSGRLDDVAAQLHAAPRDTTCVHVSDLVTLAARAHDGRRYDVEAEPDRVVVRRDGSLVFDWELAGWKIVEPGPFEGFWFSGSPWSAALDGLDVDDDYREATFVLRRGILVGIGYYELPWETIEGGSSIEYDVMVGSCHTFTEPQLSAAVSLVEPPRLRGALDVEPPT